MHKSLVILRKEWLEFRQERALWMSTLLPPLIFIMLPVSVVYGVGRTPDDDTAQLGAALANSALVGMSSQELGQAIIGQQFSLLLLLIPLIIPSILASYSVVGEKTRRTLEPLLASPIRTWELLLGKALAALLPAVGLSWTCAALFVAGIAAVSVSGRVFAAIVSPGWLVLLLLCAPLLALLAIAGMVAISSRVNDPRTAQQLSGVGVIPLMALFFGQLVGIVVVNVTLALLLALVLACLSVLAIWGVSRLFQRETILTRWS